MTVHSECMPTLSVRVIINVICAWPSLCVPNGTFTSGFRPQVCMTSPQGPGCSSLGTCFKNTAWLGDCVVHLHHILRTSRTPIYPTLLSSPQHCLTCTLPSLCFCSLSVPLTCGCAQLLLSPWWVAMCLPMAVLLGGQML